jgi:hypothetical protein
MQRVNSGEPIQTLLSELFPLKVEQKKISRLIQLAVKAKNTFEVKSCFIDYAVNFGMVNTEMQWRQNLLKNNNLTVPCIMTPDVKQD